MQRQARELLEHSFTIVPFEAGLAAAGRSAAGALFSGAEFVDLGRRLDAQAGKLGDSGAGAVRHRATADPCRDILELYTPVPVPEPPEGSGPEGTAALLRLAAACSDVASNLLRAVLCEVAPAAGGAEAHEAIMAELAAHAAAATTDAQRCSASLLRVGHYQQQMPRDLPIHLDQGLLSVIPRSNIPALRLWDRKSDRWLPAEAAMEDNEAVVLVGQQLAAITAGAAPPCLHQVLPVSDPAVRRLSAIFFLRAAQEAQLRPVAPLGPRVAVRASELVRATDAANELLARRTCACVVAAMALANALGSSACGVSAAALSGVRHDTTATQPPQPTLLLWWREPPGPATRREAIAAAAAADPGAVAAATEAEDTDTLEWRGLRWAVRHLAESGGGAQGGLDHTVIPLHNMLVPLSCVKGAAAPAP